MIVAMTTTPMITTIDELMTSERVGQATFFISAMTSR